jgi:hypothetical protein
MAGKQHRLGVFMAGIYVGLDADVKFGYEDDGEGNQVQAIIRDGRDDLARLMEAAGLAELPRTVKVRSQGGGTHWYYLQNPQCPVSQKGIGKLDIRANVNAYLAIGSGYELLDDGGGTVAVLPLELARVLQNTPADILEQASQNGHREGTYGNAVNAFNNGLTALKGKAVELGWTEEEANEAVKAINRVSADPIPDDQLEGTVLRFKGWVPGQVVADDAWEWARKQLGLKPDDPDIGQMDQGTVKRLWTTERWKLQQQVNRATEELERLEIMSGADAADETPIPWTLRDILPRTGTGAIIGGRGSYKTTITLLMAAAIQSGRMCLTRVPTPGNVVFAAGEAWEYTSRMISKIPGAENVTFTKGKFGLSVETAPRFCEKLMAFMHESPSLVVIDTLSRFHVGDENKPSDMLRVWDGADYIANALDTFVLIIAHTGHQGEHVRGASSWGQAFNTEIFTDGSILRFNKQRGIAQPADINLMYSFSDTRIAVDEGIDLARRARSIHDSYNRICRALEQEPACSAEKAYEIIQGVMKCGRSDASAALQTMVDEGMLLKIPGGGRRPAQITVTGSN